MPSGTARPVGANTVAAVKSASEPNSCVATAGSSQAVNAGAPAPMAAVQPAEPSAHASSSIISMNSTGATSKPPNDRGCSARKTPAARIRSTRSIGIVASASDSPAPGYFGRKRASHRGGALSVGQAKTGALRVSAAQARDVLWTYHAPELYELLVLERGWSAARYGEFITRALIDALLAR